ncbi:hypothetical protein [uncultured Bacteroides sp.]|uniref:hypothetical protein n=1 Tax=uncultured Bacteroides sp. TaxID=162156 RepID=UPI00280BA8F5|nr:hypothetical protein [uncultured Bacteroides sp.]
MTRDNKKVKNVMNAANSVEKIESSVLSSEELFNVEGGEDIDLDEDCYTQQCVVLASICINVSTACIIKN